MGVLAFLCTDSLVSVWQAREFDGNVYELRDQLHTCEQEIKHWQGALLSCQISQKSSYIGICGMHDA